MCRPSSEKREGEGGCWACGYFCMSGGRFVEDAVCLHRTVQVMMLLGGRKHLNPKFLDKGCALFEEKATRPPMIAPREWEEVFEEVALVQRS
jgi:hypothetical protein